MSKSLSSSEMDAVRQLLLQTTGGYPMDPANKVFVESLVKKLENLSEQFKHLSEGDKVKFTQEMSGIFEQKLDTLKQAVTLQTDLDDAARYEALQLPLCMGLLLVFVIGFFGYKLYKTLMDREEKQKAKQQRKKK